MIEPPATIASAKDPTQHRSPGSAVPKPKTRRERRTRGVGLAGVVAATLIAPTALAEATITPARGGPADSFEITFPAIPVELELQFSGPRGCRDLQLFIPIRRARTGRYRFGPRVPGARPRRFSGVRPRRWCRGRYRVHVIWNEEFVLGGREIDTARFTVR